MNFFKKFIAKSVSKIYNRAIEKERIKNNDKPLPKLTTSEEILNKSVSTKDFLREIKNKLSILKPNSLKTFKSEKGSIFTNYEKNLSKKLLKEKNKYKEKTRKKRNLSKEKGNLSRLSTANLQKSSFDITKKSRKEYDKFIEVTEKMIRSDYDEYKAAIYKENLMSSVNTQFEGSGYEKELKSLISKVDDKTLIDMYFQNENMDIDFYYRDETFNIQERAKIFYDEMIGYLKENNKIPKNYSIKENLMSSISSQFGSSEYEKELISLISKVDDKTLIDMYIQSENMNLNFSYNDETFNIKETPKIFYDEMIEYLKENNKIPKNYSIYKNE